MTRHTSRFVVASIMLGAGVCAIGALRPTLEAAQRAERWKDVRVASGRLGGGATTDPCDFDRRLGFTPFDLVIEGDQVAFVLPDATANVPSCPSDRRGVTVSRVGFSHRSRRNNNRAAGGGDLLSSAVAATTNVFQRETSTRYFVSLDYQRPGRNPASATFYFEGQDPGPLLTSISRIGKVPIEVTEADAPSLGRGLHVSVSLDPHRRLLAGIPVWEPQTIALEGDISRLGADGSTALANGALWELPAGTLRRRVRRPEERGQLTELLALNGRWLIRARNQGALNAKDTSQAGEVTIIDTMAAAPTDARVGPLPWIDSVLLTPDPTVALALVRIPTLQGGRSEGSISAIALDHGRVIWRAPVPAGRNFRVGQSDSSRVLAFGNDWIRVWQAATGENLFDLKQVPVQQAPVPLVDVALRNNRVIVVYDTKVDRRLASIDMTSGRVLNASEVSTAPSYAFRTWWSPDQSVLVVEHRNGLSLWDTDTLRPVGDFTPPPGRGRVFAGFDASGEFFATIRYDPEGWGGHVLINDVRTRTPVGQCLLGDADSMLLTSKGRMVLGYQGNRIIVCRRAA